SYFNSQDRPSTSQSHCATGPYCGCVRRSRHPASEGFFQHLARSGSPERTASCNADKTVIPVTSKSTTVAILREISAFCFIASLQNRKLLLKFWVRKQWAQSDFWCRNQIGSDRLPTPNVTVGSSRRLSAGPLHGD